MKGKDLLSPGFSSMVVRASVHARCAGDRNTTPESTATRNAAWHPLLNSKRTVRADPFSTRSATSTGSAGPKTGLAGTTVNGADDYGVGVGVGTSLFQMSCAMSHFPLSCTQ